MKSIVITIILAAVALASAPAVSAQDIVRRPGTLSEVSKHKPSSSIIQSPLKKSRVQQPRRRKRSTAAPKAVEPTETYEVKVYADPNLTALNARLCYDDFEGVPVCFPSCFFVTTDDDTDLSLSFQNHNADDMALLQFKRYDYRNSAITDLATAKAIFETFPGAQITETPSEVAVFTGSDGQYIYAKAFMHNKEVIMCMLTYCDDVRSSMEDFIPLLSQHFKP